MAVTPTTLIDVETLARGDQVWALPALLRANRRDSVELRSQWVNAIGTSISAREERVGLRAKPRRTVTFGVTAMNAADVHLMDLLAARATVAGSLIPLWCDESVITTAAGSVTTLDCDTADRRYSVGARVLVWKVAPTSGASTTAAVRTIGSLTSTSMGITSAVTLDAGSAYKVAPLMECRLEPSLSTQALSGAVTDGRLSFTELTGKMALSVAAGYGASVTGMPSHDGLPILWGSMTANEVGWERTAGFSSLGIDDVATARGDWPRVTAEVGLTLFGRATAMRALRLFESRAGQNLPFWLLSPVGQFDVVELDGTTLRVVAQGPELDWDRRPFVGVHLRVGDPMVRGVTFVSRSAGVDTLTLDSSVGTVAESNLIRVCMAHRVRFASDEYVEAWQSGDVCTSTVSVIEVDAADGDGIEIDDLGAPAGTTPNPGFPPPDGGGGSGAPDPPPPPEPPVSSIQLKHCDTDANGSRIPIPGTLYGSIVKIGDSCFYMDGIVPLAATASTPPPPYFPSCVQCKKTVVMGYPVTNCSGGGIVGYILDADIDDYGNGPGTVYGTIGGTTGCFSIGARTTVPNGSTTISGGATVVANCSAAECVPGTCLNPCENTDFGVDFGDNSSAIITFTSSLTIGSGLTAAQQVIANTYKNFLNGSHTLGRFNAECFMSAAVCIDDTESDGTASIGVQIYLLTSLMFTISQLTGGEGPIDDNGGCAAGGASGPGGFPLIGSDYYGIGFGSHTVISNGTSGSIGSFSVGPGPIVTWLNSGTVNYTVSSVNYNSGNCP